MTSFWKTVLGIVVITAILLTVAASQKAPRKQIGKPVRVAPPFLDIQVHENALRHARDPHSAKYILKFGHPDAEVMEAAAETVECSTR